ncbi:hypothetical protein [Nocardia jejuensis]|uniref:WXG100-like domain-containing protein n=1 Tax=Nocardia jejuensis TaxID=328049 RepID=UPI00082C0C7A|nr:hypothetical protein [Nocardia jejuensis]
MAVELPHEVALFLNFAGVPYPDINEDQVRELATHLQHFAANVRDTHDVATAAINNMNTVYSGYSYQQLLAVWGRMSTTHMAELDHVCTLVATALTIAADVIAVTKSVVLIELAAMASTYLIALSGSFATGGLSAVVAQVIPAMARTLLSVMEQALIAYILSDVLGKAIAPLEHAIERMINSALHSMTIDILDLPTNNSPNQPLHIEPDEVLRYADLLDDYADDMLTHATDFADRAGQLDFTTARSRDLDDTRTPPADPPIYKTTTLRPSSTPPGNTLDKHTPPAATVPPHSPSPATPSIGMHPAASGPAVPQAQPGAQSMKPGITTTPDTNSHPHREDAETRPRPAGPIHDTNTREHDPAAQQRTRNSTAPALSNPTHRSPPHPNSIPPLDTRAYPALPAAHGTAADGGASNTENPETTLQQDNTHTRPTPANELTSTSPWRSTPTHDRRTANSGPSTGAKPQPAPQTRTRPAIATPWSRIGRIPDTAMNVRSQGASLPAPWISAKRHVRDNHTEPRGLPADTENRATKEQDRQ